MLDHDSPAPRALDLLDVQVWNVYWAQVERRIGSLLGVGFTYTHSIRLSDAVQMAPTVRE